MNDNVLAVLLSTAYSRQFCGTISGSTDLRKSGGVKFAITFCNYATCNMIW